MSYPIDYIEGVGPSFAQKLRHAGVTTTGRLLQKGSTRKGRETLSEATGIEPGRILKWVNMADLYRVRGVGAEYAELLERAGVDTVKELRNRNPQNLASKMAEVNAEKRDLVRQLPGTRRVSAWVEHAKTLQPMVAY